MRSISKPLMESLTSSEGYNSETDDHRIKEDKSNSSPFSVGDKVLAFHHRCLYEAKVQRVQDVKGTFQYYIHYVGWKKSWDEWVELDRLLKHTEENLQKRDEVNFKYRGEDIAKSGQGPPMKHVNSSVARGRKRKNDNIAREEEVELENVVPIPIPPQLQTQLVNDFEFINEGKLVKLPRDPSVVDILDKYLSLRLKKDKEFLSTCKIDISLEFPGARDADTVEELLNGLRSYFDQALPLKLLYKNERKQYEEAIGVDVSPSTVYGAEHLLRLFVKLPEILYGAKIEEDTLEVLEQNLSDFLRFLQRNESVFFLSSY